MKISKRRVVYENDNLFRLSADKAQNIGGKNGKICVVFRASRNFVQKHDGAFTIFRHPKPHCHKCLTVADRLVKIASEIEFYIIFF